MRETPSRGTRRRSLTQTLFAAAILSVALVAVASTAAANLPGFFATATIGESQDREPAPQSSDPAALMTQGKLGVDLGDYAAASEAFSSVADDERAPDALRWEALVRLGLARLAVGDPEGGADAFNKVSGDYSDDPDATRFLISAVASAAQGKIWLDLSPEFEALLRSAEVASVEELGVGVVALKRVYLTDDDIELSAIFRPGRPDRSPEDNGLYEVAAYEMDKLLSLDMVPPAVQRTIGEQGSLQLWVEGVVPVQGIDAPVPADWSHQQSRIATFDSLIGNLDRNMGNILVAPGWGVVLIDHTRSFAADTELGRLPDHFDRSLVARLRTLDRETLEGHVGALLSDEQVAGILRRRAALVEHIDSLIAERGEAGVLF